MRSPSTPTLVLVMGTLLLTACGGTGGVGAADSGQHGAACTSLQDVPGGEVTAAPVDESARFPWQRSDPVVARGFDFDRIIPGGPPPDGIRPIDRPCFDDLETAGRWLEPQSPVLALEVDGDRRAYPLAIMTQHEIVNDVVGGEPVVVTYCPLCNSGLAFFRTVDGRVLDFGTSGRLFQSNLVMYDRQTKSLWVQFTGRAVVGEDFVGTELERIATSVLSWEEFRDTTGKGLVLSPESTDRDYGRNPYPGYEDVTIDFGLYRGPTDDRLTPGTRVVGLGAGQAPVAVLTDHLREERVVDVPVGDDPVTLWWAPGKASALDTAEIDRGRDVGQSAAFVPRGPEGRRLTFEPDDGDPTEFTDRQTGSTWNLAGEAVAGPLRGHRLEAVAHDDTFWFVWFGFQPDTEVIGRGADARG